MSCPNATSPINISKNTDFTCDLKCEYSFQYPNTNIQVSNRGEYLSLKTDPSREPPVVYNGDKYDASEIRLYTPSLHTYGGKHASAEMLIIHTNMSGSGNLIVCVPIIYKHLSGIPSHLDTIIHQVSKTANSVDEQTTINLSTFSLNEVVPRKPYYSYIGTLPYSPCNGTYDYIVFHIEDAIVINHKSFTKLSKIITSQAYQTTKADGGVYYNKNGPKTYKTTDDDIYIECKPTGSEGETIITTGITPYENIFNSDLLNNNLIGIAIGIALMLGLVKLAHVLISKIPSKPNA